MPFHVLCALNYVKHYFVCVECVKCGFSFDFSLKIEKNNEMNK